MLDRLGAVHVPAALGPAGIRHRGHLGRLGQHPDDLDEPPRSVAAQLRLLVGTEVADVTADGLDDLGLEDDTFAALADVGVSRVEGAAVAHRRLNLLGVEGDVGDAAVGLSAGARLVEDGAVVPGSPEPGDEVVRSVVAVVEELPVVVLGVDDVSRIDAGLFKDPLVLE